MITPAYSITATERVLPRMALDFTTGVLDPRVTVARALNTATRINSSGLIEIVNANLPRFDYDSITLAPKGLLIEEARTNNLIYSDQFDNAAWVKSGLNTTGTPAYIDVAVSPDGTQNADFMIEDTANSQHTTRVSAALLAITTYTYSFFVKAAGRINISVSRFNSAVVPSFSHTFTLTGSGASSGGTVIALSNGWYRCSGSFTTTGAGVGGFIILLSDGTGTTYLGNGTSGVYIYGAQLEAGAFATSYIPTTTLAVLRNADDVTMTGTNFTSWYSASEGTFTSTFSAAASTASVLVTDAAGSGRPLYIISGGIVRIFDGTTPINAGGTYTFGNVASAASSYGGGTMSCALNGGTVGSGAFDGSMGTSALYIGRNPAQPNEYVKGHIRKIAFYPMRFSDRQLQAFSK